MYIREQWQIGLNSLIDKLNIGKFVSNHKATNCYFKTKLTKLVEASLPATFYLIL